MAITLDGTTGVTAAEFDGALDASNLTGTLPAIDGSALTGIDTTPPTTYGAVGTYAFLYRGGSVTEGATYAGSGLQPAGNVNWSALSNDSITSGTDAFIVKGSGTVAGTWRCMGRANYAGKVSATVFVRIS